MLEKKYVYVVDKNNVVHSREIVIRSEIPDLYILKSGLKTDERILLEGIRKVRDGDKITYKYQEPNSVISNLKVYTE